MNDTPPPKHHQSIRQRHSLLGGLREALADPGVRLLLVLTATFDVVGAVIYSLLEGWSMLNSIYFATVTIATIGYGDIAPQTDAGKIFTIFFIVAGIGLFVALATAIADHLIERARRDTGLDGDADKDAG